MRNFIPNTTHASMTLRANQANSGLTVFAKQHDARSRFIHVELRDENGHIVTTGMPQLNVIHSNGTRHYIGGTYNEDGLITFELTSQLLSLAGDCKCDVSIFGDSEQSRYTLYGDGTSVEFTLPIQVIQIDELTIDGLPSEEFTYEPENGLITFEEAPADGAVISVVGQGILILTSATFTLTIGESCYSSAAIQAMDEFNTVALQIVEAKRILDEARREMSDKMNAMNPVGSGSLSMNRNTESFVGDKSATFGSWNEASAYCSFAEGDGTTASGEASHAEGRCTLANGDCSHAQGKFNVADEDARFADIVGGGDDFDARKNIEATTWTGDKRLKGDVYVGCEDDSTGGTKLEPLPAITNLDNNKVMRASNGSWIADYNIKVISDDDGDVVLG